MARWRAAWDFRILVLLIEVPLGIYIALRMPPAGLLSSLYIVLMAIPLLTPSIVVGYLWKVLTLPHAGLLYEGAAWLGFTYNMNYIAVVWLTLVLMDTWHWTSLVVLLCFAGLRAIPDDYYRAARIDGASRLGHLPLHPIAQAAAGSARRHSAALHGQFHDLHGNLCDHPRRARGFNHIPVA